MSWYMRAELRALFDAPEPPKPTSHTVPIKQRLQYIKHQDEKVWRIWKDTTNKSYIRRTCIRRTCIL